jgi:hypothetical protein
MHIVSADPSGVPSFGNGVLMALSPFQYNNPTNPASVFELLGANLPCNQLLCKPV